MAVCAVEFLVLAGKRVIYERHLAIAALETTLVPMAVLVREILRVTPDRCFALFARVSEQLFIALDTERLLITENVSVTG